MPQRFLRPGITNSDRWNSVSWRAQSLYIRILTLVDDYGRYDGRPSLIHGVCFSIWNEKHPEQQVTLTQVADDLQQLAASGLILMYDTDGKRVIQILQWQERIREGTVSKWPSAQNLQQLTCDLLLPSPTPTPSSPPNGHGMIAFEKFWKAYPRKVGKTAAEKSFFRLKCECSIDQILKAIEIQKKSVQWMKDGGQFIPHPTTWINQGRWMDEIAASIGSQHPHWPARVEVEKYAKDKGDDRGAWVSWYQFQAKNDFKKGGFTIDWKIELGTWLSKQR